MNDFLLPSGEFATDISDNFITPGGVFVSSTTLVSNAYYVGASWVSRYVGNRTEAQIYVGAETLT